MSPLTAFPSQPAGRAAGVVPGPGARAGAVPFHPFIAYADLAAARRALSVVNEVLRAAPRRFELQPMLWTLNQLGRPNWRERSLADAARASLVVITSTASGPMPETLERWLHALLAAKRGTRTEIVALLGPEDAWTVSIDQPVAGVGGHPSLSPFACAV